MDAYTKDSLLHPASTQKPNKVLVCVTPQSNCRRLIDAGHKIAMEVCGEMHILHISSGNNVFSDGVALLEELFDYGSKLGGITHGLCGSNVFETLVQFIEKYKITNVVLGMPGEDSNFKNNALAQKLSEMFPGLAIATACGVSAN